MIKKTIFILLLIIAAVFSAGAQGNNLQFGKVLLITTTAAQTVPDYKVWKVETFVQQNGFKFDYINGTSCSPANPERFHSVSINGTTYYLKQFGISNTNTNPVPIFGVNGSLWLPEKTTVALQCANDMLSIIEFNIVP